MKFDSMEFDPEIISQIPEIRSYILKSEPEP
mgnify:CR=1 FL=1